MQKMQRVGPEIKQILDKYKKYKMNDPRKAEQNKEIMAVYSREGINPVGGCIPMFLQFPIWFGLNRALSYAIELRHASWLWVQDLASKDPAPRRALHRGRRRDARRRGRHLHVSRLQDDAHGQHRSAAGANDEGDAHHDVRDVRLFSVCQRFGVVYSYQQFDRHLAAVVSEPDTPTSRPHR